MSSARPAITDPTGVPRPFDRHVMTTSARAA